MDGVSAEKRTVHFTAAPELAAYLYWLDAHQPLTWDAHEYDIFADGYRAAVEDAGIVLTAEERDLILTVRSEQAKRDTPPLPRAGATRP